MTKIHSLLLLHVNVFFKMILSEEALSQWLHLYGFFPVHLFIWSVRTQAFSQCVYLQMICKMTFFNKSSSQLLHWHGFSLVWILRCFFKITIYGEDLITLSALLKHMSIVFPQMYFKRNIAPFTTVKWFVPSVNLQMFQ